MNLKLAGLLAIYALTGCEHISETDELPDTESIQYTLPYTHAKVSSTLTLKSCEPLQAAASVTVVPVAAPSSVPEEQFVISGPALQSITRERDVSVTLHENRSLKTVNAATTDKTPSIIGNVIKLATLFASDSTAGKLTCTEDVKTLLANVSTLTDKIAALREKQYDAGHSDNEAVSKQITVLATELARLNTGPLQVKLAKTIAIQPEITAGYISWSEHHFRKWIEDPGNTTDGKKCTKKTLKVVDGDKTPKSPKCSIVPKKLLAGVPEFKLRYCIWKQGLDEGSCTAKLADLGVKQLSCRDEDVKCSKGVPVYTPKHVKCGTCSATLVFRNPVMAKFVVVADADNFVRSSGTSLADKSMPISQWGTVATLPMSVGFGGAKSVSVAMDSFGQRTAFGWKSSASGDALTGSLSTLGEQYAGFRDRDDGASLKEITDEATYLEAEQKLNRLEACREIIKSGGYECPGD